MTTEILSTAKVVPRAAWLAASMKDLGVRRSEEQRAHQSTPSSLASVKAAVDWLHAYE